VPFDTNPVSIITVIKLSPETIYSMDSTTVEYLDVKACTVNNFLRLNRQHKVYYYLEGELPSSITHDDLKSLQTKQIAARTPHTRWLKHLTIIK
jgi:hypothetical protein